MIVTHCIINVCTFRDYIRSKFLTCKSAQMLRGFFLFYIIPYYFYGCWFQINLRISLPFVCRTRLSVPRNFFLLFRDKKVGYTRASIITSIPITAGYLGSKCGWERPPDALSSFRKVNKNKKSLCIPEQALGIFEMIPLVMFYLLMQLYYQNQGSFLTPPRPLQQACTLD